MAILLLEIWIQPTLTLAIGHIDGDDWEVLGVLGICTAFLLTPMWAWSFNTLVE